MKCSSSILALTVGLATMVHGDDSAAAAKFKCGEVGYILSRPPQCKTPIGAITDAPQGKKTCATLSTTISSIELFTGDCTNPKLEFHSGNKCGGEIQVTRTPTGNCVELEGIPAAERGSVNIYCADAQDQGVCGK